MAGLVNVSGSNAFSGGTANFTGNHICTNNTVTISGSGTANFSGTGLVSPAVLDLINGTLTGTSTVTVNTVMNWTGGSMSGSGRTIIPVGVTLNAAIPSTAILDTRMLENGGTILWTGVGNFGLFSSAVITNRAGALFHAQNAASLGFFSGAARFDNAGTFRKSANIGTLTIGSSGTFNNSGTVEIQTGTVLCTGSFNNSGAVNLSAGTTNRLTAGGSARGTFTAPATTLVEWTGGTFTLNAGAQLNGAGLYKLNGGTVNANANLTVENLDLISGTLDGTSTVTVANVMNWPSGTMGGSGRTIIATGAALTVANPSSVVLSARTLENGGTALWTGAGNIGLLSGIITNRAGALFHVQNAATLVSVGGSPRFDNAGTFRKSANTGTMTVSGVSFNNSGTVDIRSGILAANGGYASSPSALLNCALGGTTAGTGYGQLQVAGTVTLNGSLSVDLVNGFVPVTNDTFTVLTAGTRNGTFANFFYPSNAVTMQLSNTANSVIVRATDVFSVPQPAPVPAGLISWWRAEGNALDTFGTNHGVLTNGATFATGNVGQTFALDGVNDFVQVPDSQTLRPVSVTIEAWVKFFATNGIRIILVKPLGSGTFDSYGLALQDGAVIAAICDNSGFGPFLTGPANTVTGQWYHLAYTFDDASKQQVLYVNGLAVASGTANKTMSYDTHPVLLGADIENGVPSFFHNGQIDEASLYNRALTRDEILTIYNAGAAGKQSLTLPPPLLHIEKITAVTARLYWSTNYPDYHLEYNPSLGTTNWAASALTPVVTDTNFVVTNLMFGAQKYYRLSRLPATYTPPPPSLTIQRAASGFVRLLWSAEDDRTFTLQVNTNLTATNWVSASPPASILGWDNVVTNPISGAQKFYRLFKP